MYLRQDVCFRLSVWLFFLSSGANMEMLGRRALWQVGLNYGHGTGHGVGNYFGVHECMFSLYFLFFKVYSPSMKIIIILHEEQIVNEQTVLWKINSKTSFNDPWCLKTSWLRCTRSSFTSNWTSLHRADNTASGSDEINKLASTLHVWAHSSFCTCYATKHPRTKGAHFGRTSQREIKLI